MTSPLEAEVRRDQSTDPRAKRALSDKNRNTIARTCRRIESVPMVELEDRLRLVKAD